MASNPNTEDGGFEDAFDRIAELGAQSESPSEMPDVPEDLTALPETSDNGEPDEQEADSAPEGDDDAPEPDDAEDDEASEAQATPRANDDELIERFAKIVQEKGQAPAGDQYIPEPSPSRELFSADEKEFLSTYEKDWPDVARAEDLRWRAKAHDLVNYVFQEVAKEISPIMQSVRTLSERTHLSDLHNTVEDYDDIRDKVIDWVGHQPAYLQSAYQHVIQQGTVEEVADLVTRWRQASGTQAQPAAPARRKAETELPTATKQAAAALAPVSSKRSAVIQGVDPNDFESAFSDFAGKM